jgi:tricarballylate dehydrogenase
MAQVDVLVVGGGNAGLVAAMTAREAGASVVLLERGLEVSRGGNTRHTRDVRYAHAADEHTPGIYETAEFWSDLKRVAGSRPFSEELARLVIDGSRELPSWMHAHGVRWQPPLRGALNLARTNLFFLGGGKALVNAYYHSAIQSGVRVRYGATVVRLRFASRDCVGVQLENEQGVEELTARAIVVASGGFEANVGWLARYWGDAAHNYIIRGTPNNDGKVLASLLANGASPVGDPRAFHAVAVDARAPKFDGGIVTRVDSIPFGIVVNQSAQRFGDEGADLWPKRYASWGGLIASQPGQLAFSVFDSRAVGQFIPPMFHPYAANSIEKLAGMLGLDPAALCETVTNYNDSARGDGVLDISSLDSNHTESLDPPKSHWALPLAGPRFYAYPLRPGVTFTYMGVTVGPHARVRTLAGDEFTNVFAAGEVMAGNILSQGYLAGFGLTIGSVFGRIAGREAAAHAAVD